MRRLGQLESAALALQVAKPVVTHSALRGLFTATPLIRSGGGGGSGGGSAGNTASTSSSSGGGAAAAVAAAFVAGASGPSSTSVVSSTIASNSNAHQSGTVTATGALGGGGGAGAAGATAAAAANATTGPAPLLVRTMTHALKHKREAQLAGFATALEAAAASHCFAEVGHTTDDDCAPSTMPLSGVHVAVSDLVDVEGFATRHDVAARILHTAPKVSHPFITWLTTHGGRVTGKLRGHSPLGYEEASDLRRHTAARAVLAGACHYSISYSFIGAAGLSACAKHDVCVFAPSVNTFSASDLRFPSSCGTLSIIARRMDDLLYFWQDYTGTLATIERIATNSTTSTAPSSTKNGAQLDDSSNTAATVQRAWLRDTVRSGLAQAWAAVRTGLGLGPSRRAHVHAFASSWSQRREGVLKIGIPMKLIDAYCGEMTSAFDFELRLRELYERNRMARRVVREEEDAKRTSGHQGQGQPEDIRLAAAAFSAASSTSRSSQSGLYRIEFVPVHVDLDLGAYVPQVARVASYELAQGLQREVLARHGAGMPSPTTPSRSKDGGGAATASPSTAHSTEVKVDGGSTDDATSAADAAAGLRAATTGLYEELPETLITAAFDGRTMSEAEYRRSRQMCTERVASLIDDTFVDVDAVCCPVLCQPNAHGNLRSVAFSLPFVVNGNPIVGMQLDADTSVMLVGERGRGTQLLEDAANFAYFLKAEPTGGWWSRFLGQLSGGSRRGA